MTAHKLQEGAGKKNSRIHTARPICLRQQSLCARNLRTSGILRSVDWLPTFQDNLSVPYWTVKQQTTILRLHNGGNRITQTLYLLDKRLARWTPELWRNVSTADENRTPNPKSCSSYQTAPCR